MKKYILLLAAFAAMTMSSCNDVSDNEDITTQNLTGYFNYVTKLETNETTITTGASYTVEYNYSTNKADIIVNNLRLPNTDYPGFTFSGAKWEYDENWKVVYKASTVPTAINYYNVPTFTDFTFSLYDEYYTATGSTESQYIPRTVISFIVDGYKVISRPTTPIFTATSVIASSTAATTSTNPVYVFTLDLEDMKLAIAVNSFVLADGTSMNAVALNKIPFTIDGETISFSRENFKSEMIGYDGDEYKYDVSALSGKYDGKSFELTYDITVEGVKNEISATANY